MPKMEYMEQKPAPNKRGRGRPVEHELPEPIPDSVENVLKTVFAGPPKKVWRYLERKQGTKR